MTFLVKVACATGTAVGIVGAGLVGSNYAFPKSEMVDIKEDAEWTFKLNLLANKVSSNESLKTKIAGDSKKTELDLKTDPANSKEFKDNNKALPVLKAWCGKAITEEDKELKNELCKKPIKKGWLFNNAI